MYKNKKSHKYGDLSNLCKDLEYYDKLLEYLASNNNIREQTLVAKKREVILGNIIKTDFKLC